MICGVHSTCRSGFESHRCVKMRWLPAGGTAGARWPAYTSGGRVFEGHLRSLLGGNAGLEKIILPVLAAWLACVPAPPN